MKKRRPCTREFTLETVGRFEAGAGDRRGIVHNSPVPFALSRLLFAAETGAPFLWFVESNQVLTAALFGE